MDRSSARSIDADAPYLTASGAVPRINANDEAFFSAPSAVPLRQVNKSAQILDPSLQTAMAFSDAKVSNRSHVKNKHRTTEVDLDFLSPSEVESGRDY